MLALRWGQSFAIEHLTHLVLFGKFCSATSNELVPSSSPGNCQPWHFRQLVAKAIREACGFLSDVACAVMADVDDESDEGEGRRPKVLRAERSSPVSIDHAFRDALDEQRLAVLPMCTLSLMFVYSELVNRNLWNARFYSGGGEGPGGGPPPQRALATRHLRHPSTDGWNVVAGAEALAQAWAVRSVVSRPRRGAGDGSCFSKAMRLRLAVCLSVAWKFERCLYTHFPRLFYSAQPSLFSPHTHELAYVGYSFLTLEEQTEFGPWGVANTGRIRALYHKMCALEADLLTSVNVMALLTRHTQVLAEDRLAALLDANVVDADAAMAMRAVVPFFRIASQDGRSAPPSAGALVCAAMLCMSVPTTVRAPVLHCAATVRAQFTADERRGACDLLERATCLKGLAVATLATTCYRDATWVHHPFVCADALRIALCMAHDACDLA